MCFLAKEAVKLHFLKSSQGLFLWVEYTPQAARGQRQQ